MTTATITAPVLELRDVTKRFGSVEALRGVSISLAPGEVHCLLRGLRTRRRAGAAFGAGRARGNAVVAARSACPSRALFGRALLRKARRGGRTCSAPGGRASPG